jgi:HEAT repeat protein
MRVKRVLFVSAVCMLANLVLSPVTRGDTAEEVRAQALAVLTSDAPFERKSAACEDLVRVGNKDCVPVLAGLLGNEQLSHRARYALEAIPDKSVDEAMRTSLDKLSGKLLSGVVSSVGTRRDPAAVPMLDKYLGHHDADVVRTAAISLGRIGTVAAGKAMLDALKAAKGDDISRICDGLLACAANLAAEGKQGAARSIYDGMLAQHLPVRFRAAALRGAVLCDPAGGMKLLRGMLHDNNFGVFAMALRVAAEKRDKRVTGVLVSEVGQLAADRVVLVIQILGQRGDRAALPLLLELAQKGGRAARLEAIRSMAEIGDGAAVSPVIELMKDKDAELAAAAAAALAALPAPEVDSAIVQSLANPDPALVRKMLELAGQRRIAKAAAPMLKIMLDKQASARALAVKSYGELAGAGGIPELIGVLVQSTDAEEIGLFERVLASVCATATDKNACARSLAAALSQAGPAAKPALLRTLRVAGGPDALRAVRGALGDANEEVHTAAVQVISAWMSVDAAPMLLTLAKSSREVDKVRALRGYLGIAMQENVSLQDKLNICREAARLVRREEEKRMLLGALGTAASGEALELIVPYLDDASVRREAVVAVVAVAEKRQPKQYAVAAKAAMVKVVKIAADDPAVVKRAEEVLKQIRNEK